MRCQGWTQLLTDGQGWTQMLPFAKAENAASVAILVLTDADVCASRA